MRIKQRRESENGKESTHGLKHASKLTLDVS
jgi:hypothetical protein